MTRFLPAQIETEVKLETTSLPASVAAPKRMKSQDLFRQKREVEIEHDGRIYRLRLTQMNKLILTA